MNSLFRSKSFRSKDADDKVVNSEEYNFVNSQKDLDNWNLPRVPFQEIYKKGTFDFLSDYTIKTVEQTISLDKDYESIQLLTKKSLEEQKKKYKFLHIGMVQVAVKPLTREGLNTSMVLCLRDCRLINFSDSILGAVQAGLNEGPVYFKCFPNFTARITDKDILESLTLMIKTHNFRMKPGNSPVAIVYRIHYKAMTTILGSKALQHSPRGETLLFKTSFSKSDVILPQKIKWNELEFPIEWNFDNAVPPKEQETDNLQQVLEYDDSSVGLKFRTNRGLDPARSSCSSIPSTIHFDIGTSSNKQKITNLAGLRNSNIPKPYYKVEKETSVDAQDSPNMSPTYSQMQDDQYVNTLRIDFKINKELLRKDFYSEENKMKREWFLKEFTPQEKKEIQEKYYCCLKKYQTHIKFFKWFELYTQENNIFCPFPEKIVSPIQENTIPIISVLDQMIETESEIDEITQTFSQEQNINRINWPTKQLPTRNYYPRPTFPDMQIEEKGQFVQASYHNDTIYEWNIDGRTEYHILNLLQEMTMVSTAYKIKQNTSDHAVAQALVAGFTGQLKGWWDHYLTQNERNSILNAYRVDPLGHVIKTEDGDDMEDAVATLIFAIAKHFIGDPSQVKDKTSELLSNLKCPKLQDFRWYKDVFLTKVMMRTDCNQAFWKEKFISGLPKLFSEKIRTKIREKNNGSIPYDKLTYGEIINTITAEGIALCNDFKLKQQLKNEQITCKNELGSFCSQFGFETIKDPPSKQHKKSSHMSKKPKRHFPPRNNYYEKPSPSRYRPKRSFRKYIPKPVKGNSDNKQKEPVCYKCGKTGHYIRDCRVKQKINQLDVSEELRNVLANLLLRSDETSEEEIQINDIDTSSDQDSEDETTDSNQEIKKNCECQDRQKTINMLSKEQEFIVDLIDKVSDTDDKKQLFSKFKETLVKQKPKTTSDPYNLKDIFERFQPINSEEISLKDLQQQINQCRIDIQDIKSYVQSKVLDLEKQNNTELELGEPSGEKTLNQEQEVFLNMLDKVVFQRWIIKITIVINKEYTFSTVALVDSGAHLNCVREGLVPEKYYLKTKEKLFTANGQDLKVKYGLQETHVCNQDIQIKQSFVVVQGLKEDVILGIPFLNLIFPITKVDEQGIRTMLMGKELIFEFTSFPDITNLQDIKEVSFSQEKFINVLSRKNTHTNFIQSIKTDRFQEKIKNFKKQLEKDNCTGFSNTFWSSNKYLAQLPYVEGFDDTKIPIKSKECSLFNQKLQNDIQELLNNKLIRESSSPWNNSVSYKKHRLFINYKTLNKSLDIKYSKISRSEALQRLSKARIFSKFNMKSKFWQVQIDEKDKYKTAFTVPSGKYEWNIMPTGLKNADSIYQDIMSHILSPYQDFSIAYKDSVLIFSSSIKQHWDHLNSFFKAVKENDLTLDFQRGNYFQTKIQFLGYFINQKRIPKGLAKQDHTQRLIGSLDYISRIFTEINPFYPIFRKSINRNYFMITEENSFKEEFESTQIQVHMYTHTPNWVTPHKENFHICLSIMNYSIKHRPFITTIYLFKIKVGYTDLIPSFLTIKFLQETSMAPMKNKFKRKIDYPRKKFYYGSGSSQVMIESLEQLRFSFPDHVLDLTERSAVILDNLQSSFMRNHNNHFDKALRAAAQHLQELEQDSTSKFLQESEFLQNTNTTKIDPNKITNPKVSGLLPEARSLAWQLFSKLPTEICQDISARTSIDCDDWFDIYQAIENNTNESLAKENFKWAKNCIVHGSPPHNVIFCRDPDPEVVMKLFEGGFLAELQIINKHQISLLPQIIQDAVQEYQEQRTDKNTDCVLDIDSANPDWEDDYSHVYPSVHLIRITSWSSPYFQDRWPTTDKERSMQNLRIRRLQGLDLITNKLREWHWHIFKETSRIIVQIPTPIQHPWIKQIKEGNWPSSKNIKAAAWIKDSRKMLQDKHFIKPIYRYCSTGVQRSFIGYQEETTGAWEDEF